MIVTKIYTPPVEPAVELVHLELLPAEAHLVYSLLHSVHSYAEFAHAEDREAINRMVNAFWDSDAGLSSKEAMFDDGSQLITDSALVSPPYRYLVATNARRSGLRRR